MPRNLILRVRLTRRDRILAVLTVVPTLVVAYFIYRGAGLLNLPGFLIQISMPFWLTATMVAFGSFFERVFRL